MPSRDGARVFIGNLPSDVRERDIERFFERYGRVRNIFIKNGKYGFCEFDDYRDADDAVYELNGKEMLGERVTVEHARGPRRTRDRGRRASWVDKYGPPTRTRWRVIVENLSTRVSWQDLKDLMRRTADVCYANAHADVRNEGIVEFGSRRDMEKAIEKYDGYELHGRNIKVFEEESSSHSRSRSRSRSRSHSRGRRSRSRDRRRSRSRSRSRSKSRSRSRDRARSKSRDRSRSRSKSRDRSRSKSRDRSRSKSRDRSRSKSRDRSRSRSRSRSPHQEDVRKRSHSRSKSADRDRADDDKPLAEEGEPEKKRMRSDDEDDRDGAEKARRGDEGDNGAGGDSAAETAVNGDEEDSRASGGDASRHRDQRDDEQEGDSRDADDN